MGWPSWCKPLSWIHTSAECKWGLGGCTGECWWAEGDAQLTPSLLLPTAKDWGWLSPELTYKRKDGNYYVAHILHTWGYISFSAMCQGLVCTTSLWQTGVLQLHHFLQCSTATLHNNIHLQVASSSEVVYNLLGVKLQHAGIARLKEVTDHRGAVEHWHLKNSKRQAWRAVQFCLKLILILDIPEDWGKDWGGTGPAEMASKQQEPPYDPWKSACCWLQWWCHRSVGCISANSCGSGLCPHGPVIGNTASPSLK